MCKIKFYSSPIDISNRNSWLPQQESSETFPSDIYVKKPPFISKLHWIAFDCAKSSFIFVQVTFPADIPNFNIRNHQRPPASPPHRTSCQQLPSNHFHPQSQFHPDNHLHLCEHLYLIAWIDVSDHAMPFYFCFLKNWFSIHHITSPCNFWTNKGLDKPDNMWNCLASLKMLSKN